MAETAAAIANYFIDKALEDDRELTPMKLIKLVYLAHGWRDRFDRVFRLGPGYWETARVISARRYTM
jgi:hypothetical protein